MSGEGTAAPTQNLMWKCLGCPYPSGCLQPCSAFGNHGAAGAPPVFFNVPVDGSAPVVAQGGLGLFVSPPAPQGWECPKCHRINAPTVLECPCSGRGRT